jgi:hypothetical protein
MKIESKEIEVTKVVETKVKETVVTLTLSKEEALVLKALSGSVCGIGKNRIITDSIFNSLDEIFDDDTYGKYFTGTLNTVKVKE